MTAADPLSPRWKANERKPFLEMPVLRNDAGTAVPSLVAFGADFFDAFFFATDLVDFEAFLPDFLDDFVTMTDYSLSFAEVRVAARDSSEVLLRACEEVSVTVFQ
jgi:hypothetical protein